MMLNLDRYVRQSIMIGDDVKIIILGIQDGKVRIGIQASREIKVLRKEVYERINQEDDSRGHR